MESHLSFLCKKIYERTPAYMKCCWLLVQNGTFKVRPLPHELNRITKIQGHGVQIYFVPHAIFSQIGSHNYMWITFIICNMK